MKNFALYAVALLAVANFAAAADSAPVMMNAVVAHKYGGPEVLKFEQVPKPEPKENEALVRVIAAGVNPADPLIVGGKYAKEFGTHLPLIPGYDIAGIVEKTGANVTTLKVGDEVYGYPLFGGGWAEFATVTENEAAAKPTSLNFTEAAAVPLAALTAWQALVDIAQLKEGQTILIHGGSGGVGSFAVQIAKARGARVIATASTANQDLLKQLGADVAVDYTKTKFEEIAKDVDAVLDPVGDDTLARSYAVVKMGGIVMSLVDRPDPAELEKRGIRGASISVKPDAEDLAEIALLIDANKIKPVVTEVLPMSDATEALTQAETHHTRGKLVLRIAHDPATTPPLGDAGQIAEKYVKLVLAMSEHDKDYVDAYYGPPEWKEKIEKKTLAEIREEAMDLFGNVAQLPVPEVEIEHLRLEYLAKQLSALEARVRILQGEKMKFDEESRALYDAVAPSKPESHFQKILDQLETKMPGQGTISRRYEEWRKDFVIPRDKLDAVFQLAIKECRARTLAHIKLPPNESFMVEYVTGKSWSGYNWYQGNFAASFRSTRIYRPTSTARSISRHTKVIPAIMFTTCSWRKISCAIVAGWSSPFTRFFLRNRSSPRAPRISVRKS
ncbi:MAG: NADP-dependent oxidoreductase [Chthoniobacterales bacterium]